MVRFSLQGYDIEVADGREFAVVYLHGAQVQRCAGHEERQGDEVVWVTAQVVATRWVKNNPPPRQGSSASPPKGRDARLKAPSKKEG